MVTHHLLSPLRPPRSANSTDGPFVRFSLACGNVSKTAVSFDNSFIHLPSFLPLSFTHPINLSFLPSPSLKTNWHAQRDCRHEWGVGDNMKNIAYHEKLILKAPTGLIVRPTSTKPTFLIPLCLLLLLPFNEFYPPSQTYGTSHAEMIPRYFFSLFFYHHFALFKSHIHISVFDFFSFLFFSFLFFSVLFCSVLFCSFGLFRLIVL